MSETSESTERLSFEIKNLKSENNNQNKVMEEKLSSEISSLTKLLQVM